MKPGTTPSPHRLLAAELEQAQPQPAGLAQTLLACCGGFAALWLALALF